MSNGLRAESEVRMSPSIELSRCTRLRLPAIGRVSALGLLALAGCAQMPIGPTVQAMPPPYKPFEVFAAEDRACRDWAAHSSGSAPVDAAAQDFAGATVAGTVIGAAVGGLAGGQSGAGVGAAFGMLTGAAVGADQSYYRAYGAQGRYDMAYQQCMYAKGNGLPGYSSYRYGYGGTAPAVPLPPAGVQPPPATR
jgi:hypothetical protein